MKLADAQFKDKLSKSNVNQENKGSSDNKENHDNNGNKTHQENSNKLVLNTQNEQKDKVDKIDAPSKAPSPNKMGLFRRVSQSVKDFVTRKIETGKKIARGLGKGIQVTYCFVAIACEETLPPIGKAVLDLSNGFLSLLTAFPKFIGATLNFPKFRQVHFLWLANMLRYCVYGSIVVGVETIFYKIPQALFSSNAQNEEDAEQPARESTPSMLYGLMIYSAGNTFLIYFAYRAVINNKLLNLSKTHESQKLTLQANKALSQYARNNLDITDLTSMFRDLRAQAFGGFEGIFIGLFIALARSPYSGPYSLVIDRAMNISLKAFALGTEMDAYPLHITGISKPDVHNIQTHRKLICFGKGLIFVAIEELGISPLLSMIKPHSLTRLLGWFDTRWFGPEWYRNTIVSSSFYSLFKLNYIGFQNIKIEKEHLKDKSGVDLFHYPRDFTVVALSRGLTSGLPILGKAVKLSRRFLYILPIVNRFMDPSKEIIDNKERGELAPVEDAVNLLKSMTSLVDWTDPATRMFFYIYKNDLIKLLNYFKAFRSRGVLKLLQFMQFFVPTFMGGDHIGLVIKYLMEKVPDEEIDNLIHYIEKQAKFGEENQHMSLKSWLSSVEGWKERVFDNPDAEPEDYEFIQSEFEIKEELETISPSTKIDQEISAEISKIYGCVGDYGFLENGEAFKQVYDFFYEKLTGQVKPWKEESMTPEEIDEARKENPVDPNDSLDPYKTESLLEKFDRNSRELLFRLKNARSAFEQFSSKVTNTTPGGVVRGAINYAESAQEQLGQITGAETALNVAGAAATLIPGGGLVAGSIGLFNLTTRNAQMFKFFAAWLDDKKVDEKKQITEFLGGQVGQAGQAEQAVKSGQANNKTDPSNISPAKGLELGKELNKNQKGESVQKPVIKFTIEKFPEKVSAKSSDTISENACEASPQNSDKVQPVNELRHRRAHESSAVNEGEKAENKDRNTKGNNEQNTKSEIKESKANDPKTTDSKGLETNEGYGQTILLQFGNLRNALGAQVPQWAFDWAATVSEKVWPGSSNIKAEASTTATLNSVPIQNTAQTAAQNTSVSSGVVQSQVLLESPSSNVVLNSQSSASSLVSTEAPVLQQLQQGSQASEVAPISPLKA